MSTKGHIEYKPGDRVVAYIGGGEVGPMLGTVEKCSSPNGATIVNWDSGSRQLIHARQIRPSSWKPDTEGAINSTSDNQG